MFLFTSDNGYFLGEHRFRAGKSKAYEPSIRVPLLLAGPGIPHGVRHDPATTQDLTEAMLSAPRHRDERARARGFHDARSAIGVRTARWKLIRYSTGFVELYDLDRDPNELSNLARRPAYADVRRALTRIWWSLEDCDGQECLTELPARFRLTATEAASSTRRQSRGIRATFGVTF